MMKLLGWVIACGLVALAGCQSYYENQAENYVALSDDVVVRIAEPTVSPAPNLPPAAAQPAPAPATDPIPAAQLPVSEPPAATEADAIPEFSQAVQRDVPYVPTPNEVVDGMLRLAEVGPNDVVYDLGCGDGRIVITAAQQYGARGVGIDIDPQRIKESRENARSAGVENRVKFIEQDLFDAEFRDATVVMLYLLPDVNMRLRPKLLEQLEPGTRVVSHSFDMGDWEPAKTEHVDGKRIYLWIVPEDPSSIGRQ